MFVYDGWSAVSDSSTCEYFESYRRLVTETSVETGETVTLIDAIGHGG